MPGTIVRLVCAVTLLALTTAPAVAQTPIDKRIDFTFSAPVSLPGVTLPPGTYQFRLINPHTSRDVVGVFDKDGLRHYGSFLVGQAYRPEPTDSAEVRFIERRADAPYAIRAWWYPAERIGFEPVYPREQALQLARESGEPVLASRATAAALMDANGVSRVSASADGSADPLN